MTRSDLDQHNKDFENRITRKISGQKPDFPGDAHVWLMWIFCKGFEKFTDVETVDYRRWDATYGLNQIRSISCQNEEINTFQRVFKKTQSRQTWYPSSKWLSTWRTRKISILMRNDNELCNNDINSHMTEMLEVSDKDLNQLF